MDVDALFRGHATALRRYLFRLTGDGDAADDALQEAFVRALARPPTDSSHARAWLYTVATNVARDHARRDRRVGAIDAHRVASTAHGAAPVSTPAEDVERLELRRRLLAALDTLGAREREAILMREEGFAHREIAEALGTTTGTIGTLLARALAKLARELQLDRDEP